MILGLDLISWVGVVILVFLLSMLGYGIRRFLGWNKYCRAVDAMQRGDIDTLTVAPPPRSLYDFYIDRITQGFILNQYEKITHRWLGYRGGIGRVRAAEELAELEHQKTRSSLHADMDEQNLRGSQARRESWKLWEPAKAEQAPKTPREVAEQEKQYLEDQKTRVQKEIKDKEDGLAGLEKDSDPWWSLKHEIDQLYGLISEINKKIYDLRRKSGI